MLEQWFLDLDGVRSGPYQTSEVMSLVAEGEILPHHQIATELKSQTWMTILEWRLNQNRNSEPKQEYVTQTLIDPIIEPVIETAIEPVVEPIISVRPPVEVISSSPPPMRAPEPAGKRDPVSEMFDMLQNTKQKREDKIQKTKSKSNSNTTTSSNANPTQDFSEPQKQSDSRGYFGKTIIIGLIITIIGFALGQIFQQKNSATKTADNPPAAINGISNSSLSPTPATAMPTNTPEQIKTVDRSTDKLTIRAQVPATPSREDAKDMQELRDLKKELQELKALKENLNDSKNNSPGQIDAEPSDIIEDLPVDPSGNPNPGNPAVDDVHY